MTRLRSAVLLLLVTACAHEPPPPATDSKDSGLHAEIATLEKRIAERKSSLSEDSPQAQSVPVPMSSGEAAPITGGSHCDGVCQAAEEICTCHRRICRLASEINDDKSATSCRRSQRSCEEAGRACAVCH